MDGSVGFKNGKNRLVYITYYFVHKLRTSGIGKTREMVGTPGHEIRAPIILGHEMEYGTTGLMLSFHA
jgi:hypothetical protein